MGNIRLFSSYGVKFCTDCSQRFDCGITVGAPHVYMAGREAVTVHYTDALMRGKLDKLEKMKCVDKYNAIKRRNLSFDLAEEHGIRILKNERER